MPEHTSARRPSSSRSARRTSNKSSSRAFAAQAAIHRDRLAVRDPEPLCYGERDLGQWDRQRDPRPRRRRLDPVALLLPQGVSSVAAILGALKSGSPYVSLYEEDPRGPRICRARRRSGRALGQACRTARGSRWTAGPRRRRRHPRAEPETSSRPLTTSHMTFSRPARPGKPKGVFDSLRNVCTTSCATRTCCGSLRVTDCLSFNSPAFSGTASTCSFGAAQRRRSLFPHRLATEGIASLAQWLRRRAHHDLPLRAWDLPLARARGRKGHSRSASSGSRVSRTSVDVELHRRHFRASPSSKTGSGSPRQASFASSLWTERRTGRVSCRSVIPSPASTYVIVDDDVTEVTPGTAGEIAVQSGHLALGYWGDDALTRAMFPSVRGRRTYLTGDLGRLREDGCVEYLGRKDGELKILGRRVEPAEVEAEILRLPGVKDAAVTTREGRRRQGQLVAYIVSESTGPEAREIREALRERLPPYMIPAGVVFLDELPLGPAGEGRPASPAGSAAGSGYCPCSRNGARAQHRAHLGTRPRDPPSRSGRRLLHTWRRFARQR